ncbi:Clp protease N-terminal domain-containing protein [Kribbella solani]|uniref:Clp protease N-terminal domain-containing protein n=1 Tax=Kribbella solani TaxID=236067 RepID=UPI0029B03166|nr:Clp protease N-terminal domain-containing protein [Kribbella solani]MDX2973857.1 Clp protease N-terminal domain-containing protein [Kribbella solani]MDX3000631.1 Clp protease N-terminal domain-containing protein [Kribbella solani]
MSDAKDVRSILVHAGRAEARRDGSRTIEAEHVLLALAGMQDSSAARMLAAAGLTEAAIRAALDSEWEQSLAVAGIAVRAGGLPPASPEPGRDPQIGESTKLVLRRGTDAAPKGARFGPMRILVGLLDSDRGRVARALQAAGVDRTALHAEAAEALAKGTH